MSEIIAVACFILTACTSNAGFVEELNYGDIELIKVSVKDFVYHNQQSRTSVSINDNGAAFTWSSKDTIGIFPSRGNQVSFPMEAGAGSNCATFTGGDWALKATGKYAAYYPYNFYNRDGSKIELSWVGQKQNGNNSTGHISAFDYMATPLMSPSEGHVSFDFEHLGALLQFKLTIPKAMDCKKMKLSIEENIFVESSLLSVISDNIILSNIKKSNSIDIELSDIQTKSANEEITIYTMVAPTDLSNKEINVSITNSDGSSYYGIIKGKNWERGKIYSNSVELREPSELGAYVDLSAGKNINCFVIETNGKYKFMVNEHSGTKAFLLWNENGEKDITDVKLIDNYICFEKTSFNKGNAMISLAGDEGIVWSWHIWSTDKPGNVEVDGLYWMDRNMGATTTKPDNPDTYGLLYNPGNPFPFPGPKYEDYTITETPSVPEGWYVAPGYGFYTSTSMPDASKPMQLCTRTDVFGNSIYFRYRYNQLPYGYNLPSASKFQDLLGYEPTIKDGGIWVTDGLYIPCISNCKTSDSYGVYLCSGIYNNAAVDTWTITFYEGVSKKNYCTGAARLPIRCYSSSEL